MNHCNRKRLYILYISIMMNFPRPRSLQWRHNERNGVSNRQLYDCLLNRLSRRRSKKISKLRITGLCEWNSPVNCEFPVQRTSNAENVSIWWRHHVYCTCIISISVSSEVAIVASLVQWGSGYLINRIHNSRNKPKITYTCFLFESQIQLYIVLKLSHDFFTNIFHML